jgi:hypothetical protein
MKPQSEIREISGLRHFKGLDWVTWKGEHSWCAFRGGYNGGNHNNHDLGHIIFGIDKDRFLCDPGYGAKQADMHSCPVIRFHDQTECAAAPITVCTSEDHGFRLSCDISEAFPHVLDSYIRQVAVLDDAHLVIIDEILGNGRIRNDAQYNLQTSLPAEETEDGFIIRGKQNALRIVIPPGVWAKGIEQWKHGRGGPSQEFSRLKWYDEFFRVRSVMVTACTCTDLQVSHAVNEKTVSVTIGDKTWEFASGI